MKKCLSEMDTTNQDNEIDPDKIKTNEEKRTRIMIKNIPKEYKKNAIQNHMKSSDYNQFINHINVPTNNRKNSCKYSADVTATD